MGRFPFLGDTLAWASLRGGKALGVTKPAFPPRTPPFRARHCSALWYGSSVLVNACMLLYWWRQAEPIFLFRRTEGGLRSRPVPGGCCIAGANLLLPVVLLVLTCSCLSLYCRRSLAPVCCRITGIDLLLSVAVLPALTCSCLLSHHWHRPTSVCCCIADAHLLPSIVASLA